MKRRSYLNVLLLAIIVTLFIPVLLYLSLGYSNIESVRPTEVSLRPRSKHRGRKLDSVSSNFPKIREGPKSLPPRTHPTVRTVVTPQQTTTRTPNAQRIVENESTTNNSSVNGTGQTLNKAFLEKLNSLEHVYNADDFPALSSEDMIFVVQVHKRIHYLRYLLESFSQAKDIGQVLLIFSHDYYDEEINKQIQSIKYCKVLQLFFPYSMQLHPNTFPGESPDDCGRDFTREQARKVKCANWEHPDHYGHYRTASVTAIKHHWWWKINKVFDGLKLTANFNGTVFFLEEDHYISPDAVMVARDLVQLRRRECQQCDFVNLGMYTGNSAFSTHSHLAYGTLWYSAKHNMGFGMDRQTWTRIRSCSSAFCEFDDYNWDWSMSSLSKSCIAPPLRVLLTSAPRIFHAGTCGTHQKKSCDWDKDIRRIRSTLQNNKNFLFPNKLELTADTSATKNFLGRIKSLKGYGGWGDPRDVALCRSFVYS